MTERINSITVVLEKDIREDDAEYILNAIRMIKGVLSVSGNVSSPSDYVAEMRAISKIRNKMYGVLDER